MANRVNTPPIWGDFELGNNVETTNNTTPVALALTVDEGLDAHPDWAYSASAENNGGGGSMDDAPGIIYSGPPGTSGHFTINMSNVDVVYAAEGISDPDAEDTVSVDIYVNSTALRTSAEGQTANANEAATIEFNLDEGRTVPLATGDVLRFALTPVAANEATIDWDVLEGGEWSAV